MSHQSASNQVNNQEGKKLSTIELLFEHYAKWAPSGDNIQPYRIEVCDEHSCIIRAFDTRDSIVYDLQGSVSKISLGCLIENFAIAAESFGYQLTSTLIDNQFGMPPSHNDYSRNPSVKIAIRPAKKLSFHPLFPYIQSRTVQRASMNQKSISNDYKALLEGILPDEYEVKWFEGTPKKLQIAKLMYQNATTRLSMREGYEVHSKIIEFTSVSKDKSLEKNMNAVFSKDKLPAYSLGVDRLTLWLTKWAMKSWPRFNFIERYCFGTVWAKLLMDFKTSIHCGAHFVIVAKKPPSCLEDYIDAGRAIQRFWLQASKLKLGFQPEYSPIIFSEYIRDNIAFTENESTNRNAHQVDKKFRQLIGEKQFDNAVFMGRVGYSTLPRSRTTRLSLDELRFRQ